MQHILINTNTNTYSDTRIERDTHKSIYAENIIIHLFRITK